MQSAGLSPPPHSLMSKKNLAMASTVLVALYQGHARDRDVQHNMSKIKEQTLRAKAAGAQLIVFPELFLTGYCLKAEDMRAFAQERGGEAFQELSALARETGVGILYGYPEKANTPDGIKYFNSAQLIDKEGKALVNHQKVHLWIDKHGYEKVFTPADNFSQVTEYCGLKIGVLICYDVEFPEAVRTLVLKGANLILVPTAVGEEIEQLVNYIIPARAYENTVCVAYVNNTGSIFAGRSVCYNGIGKCLASAGGEEELLLVTITVGEKVRADGGVYLRDRRPQLYEK